ncbi:fungal-specific transcription factor domain-containing protein [Pyronema domesticum]|nr:fungal-specific transcription factor domain-containing protein [Pyronema domesticum]
MQEPPPPPPQHPSPSTHGQPMAAAGIHEASPQVGGGDIGVDGGPQSTTPTTLPSRPRRPFQARRKERSCDSCKVRKTKCDAQDDNPCSACLAAKLPCTFSSADHEGRKIGPTRKIRELQKTVEELTKRLQIAEQRQRRGSRDDTIQDNPSRARSMASSLVSNSGSYSDTASSTMRGDAESASGLSPGSSYGRSHYDTGYEESPPQATSDINNITWNPNAFGPGSAPQFVEAYAGFLQRNGLPAHIISGESSNLFEKAEPVPLLSDIIPARGLLPLDLRAFFPREELYNRLVEAFRVNIQNFMPIFYWPALELKLQKAFNEPLYDQEKEKVRDYFCPVMLVLAVGAQLIRVDETYPVNVGAATPMTSQERHGWRFFELGRKYLDLNLPSYSYEYATVLLLMSIYLDKATLPSPCWMICGAMGRVCQDIGLGRQPPNSKFSPLELEARSRLFWGAYIQDKRVSMKMGRPWILRSEDCDVPLPATLDDDGVGAPVSGLPPDSQPVRDQVAVTRRALSTFKATIHACKTVESVLGVKPLPRKGGEDHKNRLQELDHELLKAWAMLPPELSDAERPEPLDFACVRVLFITQHARLILFRHFLDQAPPTTERNDFQTWCLSHSITIARKTARLMYRAQMHPRFEDEFGVVTDDLCHLHLFRVAALLLLGLYFLRDSGAKQEELLVCVRSLQAVAKVHITGRRFLELFKKIAGHFNNPLSQAPIPNANRTQIGQGAIASAGASQAPQPLPPQGSEWDSSFPIDYSQLGVTLPETYQQDPAVIGQGEWSSFQDILQWNPHVGEPYEGHQHQWGF